ncbi:hypothetical protein [Arthrobacter sp. NicSoilB8]|uniref:hypothetical protein n=1 Tax=Arthrobacter sp. NicSoilB8 TaxID=2830998 RepID=UPI001CC6D800|nr:hypothetical protein [Arthrobacter sp. NicSoilB8]
MTHRSIIGDIVGPAAATSRRFDPLQVTDSAGCPAGVARMERMITALAALAALAALDG